MPTEDPVESLLDRWDSALGADPRANLDAFLSVEGSQLDDAQRALFRLRAEALAVINRGLDRAVAVSSGPLSGGISPRPDGSAPSVFTAGMEPVSGYVLESRIGKGGFGEVWRATGPGGMPVALKIISRRSEKQRTELQSLATIKGIRHPHLLAVTAYWEHGDTLFIASELADGTLLGRLQQVKDVGGTGIPVDELLRHMTDAAEGIDFLNSPQSTRPAMQHGDIKPQNLLLMSGSVKVGDFGLIRPLSDVEVDHHGTMTVQYAAPEFLDGRLSAASDQFSLAVTYCCLRTGRLPFGGTLLEYRASIRKGRADLSGLTAAESAVVRRALAVKPTKRFSSCCAFVSELKAALGSGRAPVRRRYLITVAVSAACLVAIAGIGVRWFWGRQSQPPPPLAPFDAVQARKHQEDWAKHLGIPVETTNSIGQSLVVIPPGRFTMGEYDETVDVALSKPFLLGQTEVTQGQWKRVMGTEPWKGQEYTTEGTDVAATFVSWSDAVAFCAMLTEQERGSGRIGREQAYRLPTEAEWEFACRAGMVTKFSFGDDEGMLGDYAWFGGGWKDEPVPGGNTAGEMYPHAVRLKRPNAFGLYDMHGNVWEWCSNWCGERGSGAVTDPQEPFKEPGRVIRGGDWMCSAGYCRSAFRDWVDPSAPSYFLGYRNRIDDFGFRVVLSAPGVKPTEATKPPAVSVISASTAPPPAVAPFDAAQVRKHQADWAEYLGIDVEVTNSIGQTLVVVPPGSFTMGEGDKTVDVTLTKPFLLGQTEVTNAQWKRVMGNVPSKSKDADHPVETVNWDDAVEFCRKLSALPDERQASREYRLPTEAEWEYACRAGTTTRYSFGDDDSRLGEYGWFTGNSLGTHPVGKKKPNAWGLFDMYGNVFEWCNNWYDEYPKGVVTDPQGPSRGSFRVRRGGSWSDPAWLCRSAVRVRFLPSFRNRNLGFRLALSTSGIVSPEAAPTR